MSTQNFGILGVGAYLPRLRLDRATVAANHKWMAPGLKGLAKGTRTMANWDEDALTMAVEAGRAALAQARPGDVASLTVASTSLPFADRLNASVVCSALALSHQINAMDASGGMRAGSSALLRALQAGQAGVVIGTERRIPTPASTTELSYGDGAAAVVVGSGSPIAILKGSASAAEDFVDHFREAGNNGDYGWEERWVREEGYGKIIPPVVKRALEAAGIKADEIDHFVMPAPLQKVNQVVAKKLGIRAEAVADALFEVCGDTGVAHPLLMLAKTLAVAGPGQKILLVQFGGGCDALVLETTAKQVAGGEPAWLGGGRTETNYLKYLSFTGQIDLEWGMRAEMDNKTALTAAWRSEAMVQGFVAGKCSKCGTVQYPSTRICVNPACDAIDTQEPHRLADEPAKIRSYTCDWLSYKQSPPFMFGHVEFETQARVQMEFTDCDPGELAVGNPLAMTFRIKEVDPLRGFRRYCWKAKALRQNGGA